VLDRQIAEGSTDDPAARRLFTITGVDLTVATGLMAAIGNISRFEVDLFDFAPWGTCSSRGSFEGDAHRNSTMEKVARARGWTGCGIVGVAASLAIE
jgi:hypothetical protein